MTIADVSKKYHVSAYTLRYYESIGLLPAVARTKGGIRDYSENDCSWVEFIKCMRSAGMPVEALIEYVSLFKQGDSTNKQRKQILSRQRDLLIRRMDEMQKNLERLNSKIDHYDEVLAVKEQKLSKAK